MSEEILKYLKKWRLKKALSSNLPAYCILKDKTLELIATQKPVSKSELIALNGIGYSKLDKYGLEIISPFFKKLINNKI